MESVGTGIATLAAIVVRRGSRGSGASPFKIPATPISHEFYNHQMDSEARSRTLEHVGPEKYAIRIHVFVGS